jgi:hypothetical protein
MLWPAADYVTEIVRGRGQRGWIRSKFPGNRGRVFLRCQGGRRPVQRRPPLHRIPERPGSLAHHFLLGVRHSGWLSRRSLQARSGHRSRGTPATLEMGREPVLNGINLCAAPRPEARGAGQEIGGGGSGELAAATDQMRLVGVGQPQPRAPQCEGGRRPAAGQCPIPVRSTEPSASTTAMLHWLKPYGQLPQVISRQSQPPSPERFRTGSWFRDQDPGPRG